MADEVKQRLAALEAAIISTLTQPQADEVTEAWRPIETATKDRTRRLLLWLPDGGLLEHIELGYWSSRKHAWVNTYGNAYSGGPDMWAPVPPLAAMQAKSQPEGVSDGPPYRLAGRLAPRPRWMACSGTTSVRPGESQSRRRVSGGVLHCSALHFNRAWH